MPEQNAHEHAWDTEDDEFATYVPDAAYDWPWIIHECCEPGCNAIKVTRHNRLAGQQLETLVFEVVADTPVRAGSAGAGAASRHDSGRSR